MRQPESSPPTNHTLSGAHSGAGTRVEHAKMPSKIRLTTVQFTLADAPKHVEGQNNVEELCKTMRDVMDDIMELSSKETLALKIELGRKLSA